MPQTGHFILHSNVVPPVVAGSYELRSEHDATPFAVADESTHVTVSAPRYVMPIDQILSSFPPANAEGAFGDRLPQIVLKRRTLPWERNPYGGDEPIEVPWLALVVVAEGEAELSSTSPVSQCVTPGTPLLDPADRDVEQGVYLTVTQTVLDRIFPCEEDLRHLVHVREVDIGDTELANGDDDGWLAVVIANRLPVFDTASGRSVRYMACLVNVEGQIPSLPPPQAVSDFFEFQQVQDWSVVATALSNPDHMVMGSPLGSVTLPGGVVFDAAPSATSDGAPDAAARSRAVGDQVAKHLAVGAALDGAASSVKQVSIASQWSSTTDFVAAAAADPDAKLQVRSRMRTGWHFPIEAFAIEPVYRFPVLAHWSFTTNEGATFETLMQDLDVNLIGALPGVPAGAPPPASPPPEVVETGHISLGSRTRRGDPTRAWYRGPLTPFPTKRDELDDTGRLPVAHSADQLRSTVPDSRDDLSLAAAFEIGRLLGLSQLSVVSALLRFRSEQFGAGRAREVLDRVTDFDLPTFGADKFDLGRFVALEVLDGFVKQPDLVIGPRRPIADPGREIEVKGSLDTVIASGLGLDEATLRKAGEQIGIVAALASTDAPIGRGDIERYGKDDIVALRSAIESELSAVLSVAVPEAAFEHLATPVDRLDDLITAAEQLAGDEGGD